MSDALFYTEAFNINWGKI